MSRRSDSSHTQQQVAVIVGLKQLRRTNRMGGCPLTDAQINSPEVEAYLLRGLDEDPEADARFEKDIQAAVYLSVKRSKWKPRRSAKLLARQAVEELRAARLTTLYHDKRIDARTYQEECENNYVQNTLSVARRIKKRYGRRAVKTGLTEGLYLAGAPYAAAAAGAAMLGYALIPKKYKEKIRKKSRELATQAIETVGRGLRQLKEKGRKAVQKVQDTLTRTFETARQLAEPVVAAARSVAERAMEKVDKAKEKVKSFFRRLFK